MSELKGIMDSIDNTSKVVSDEPKLYTQAEVDALIQEIKDDAYADKFIRDNDYYFNEIASNENVAEHRNVLAIDYKLREMLPLIKRIGFDKFNDLVMRSIDKNNKDEVYLEDDINIEEEE